MKEAFAKSMRSRMDDEMEEPAEDDSDYEGAAGEIMAAIEAGDAKSLAEALRNFVSAC